MNRQFSSPATRPLPPPPPQAEGRASPVRRMSGVSIPGVPLSNPPPPGFNVNMNNINVNVNFPPTVGHAAAAGFRLQDLGAIPRDYHRKTSLDLPLTARQISLSSSRSLFRISSVTSLNSPIAERRQESVRQFQNLSVTGNSSLSSSQHTIRGPLGVTDIPSEAPEAYLIRLQEDRYHKTLREVANWETSVSRLKNENKRKEMEKWLRLNPRDPLVYSKIEELTNMRDVIRTLKVEILSLVAEVDEYGDIPLGDVNRSSKKKTPLAPQKTSKRDDEPPPIPPRIPIKPVAGQTILDIHVPAPNLPLAYRGSIVPPLPPPKSLAIPNGPLLNRSHSNVSQNSMASSPSPGSPMNGNGRIIGSQKQMSQIDDKDEDEEIQKWRCTKCQFDNLFLRECEMCHTPRISYPISSDNLRMSTLSLSSQQGAIGGNF